MQKDSREDWELTLDEQKAKRAEIRKRQDFLDEVWNCKDLPKPTPKLRHLVSGLGLIGILIGLTFWISVAVGFPVGVSRGARNYENTRVFLCDKFDEVEREANYYKNEAERISREFQQYKEKIEKIREVRTEY